MAESLTIRELLTTWGVKVDDKQLVQLGVAIEATKKKAESLGNSFAAMGQKISGVGMSLTKWITAPLVGGVAGILALSEKLDEFRNKSDVIFKDAAESVRQWTRRTGIELLISKKDLMGYTEQLYQFAKANGIVAEQQVGFAEELARMAVLQAAAAPKEISPDRIIMLYRRAIASGKLDMLKGGGRFAPLVDEKGVKAYADAISHGLKPAQAVYNAILASGSDALAFNAKRQGELSASILRAKLAVKGLADDLIILLEPGLKQIADFIRDLTEKWRTMDDEQKKNLLGWLTLAILIGPL